jgi:hypothetical protein
MCLVVSATGKAGQEDHLGSTNCQHFVTFILHRGKYLIVFLQFSELPESK